MVSLRVRKASTLACNRWLARVSFLLTLQLSVLSLEIGELLLQPGPPGQGLAGQVFPTDLEGLLRLRGQLVGLGVQPVGLELDPLATGRNIGDAPPNFLQQLELSLV